MRPIASWFIILGVVSALLGMLWGIQMAATHDHALSPAHGHLNLVGWVSLMLFGLYYQVNPAAELSRLAKVHLIIAVVGVALLVPGIAMAISGRTELLAILGSFVTLASMCVFAAVVLRYRNV